MPLDLLDFFGNLFPSSVLLKHHWRRATLFCFKFFLCFWCIFCCLFWVVTISTSDCL